MNYKPKAIDQVRLKGRLESETYFIVKVMENTREVEIQPAGLINVSTTSSFEGLDVVSWDDLIPVLKDE